MTSTKHDDAEQPKPVIAFVTGKLAEPALRQTLADLETRMGFKADVVVAKITVAALMTVDWLVGKLQIPHDAVRVVLPGWCRGDVEKLSRSLNGVPVERGPKDLRDLPRHFCQDEQRIPYGDFDIEILAEINHANRLPVEELIDEAMRLEMEGADVIDLGATPGEPWDEVETAVREMSARGLRVSIDSFDPTEIERAVRGGAELVLSVNEDNCAQAADWGAEVVALPDQHRDENWLQSLEHTVNELEKRGVRYRLDPILEPIGFGFAESLHRYYAARQRFPSARMMMGVGNLTELTESDTAGVNALLIGYCQELAIDSVLTTQVINWARSSVREIDVARRLMKYAVSQNLLPKHRDNRLLMLRDEHLAPIDETELRRLQSELRDPNIRIFASDGQITAMNGEKFESDADPFLLFERLGVDDPSHAFYLGWEMMKAATALQLGKRYVQDESLDWGLLTVPEVSHRDRKAKRQAKAISDDS